MRGVVEESLTGVIRVSAVVLRDTLGSVLTVRRRGTRRFMLPGGKPGPDESATDAAIRECAEELGVVLDPGALHELGRPAAVATRSAATAGRTAPG